MAQESPLRQQYLAIRRSHPGLILLFQIGDFYETFDEDAEILARDLGVALTRKVFGKNDVHPLAGIPVRSLTTHLGKLLAAGHKIAICDQVTLPGKGLVEREVVRVVTPGTVIEPGLLEGRSNNYLASLIVGGDRCGLACADVTTGEFRVTELPADRALAELVRLGPAEVLCARELRLLPGELPEPRPLALITYLPDEHCEPAAARAELLRHFGVTTLAAYGCEDRPLAAAAAGVLVRYLRDTQPEALLGLMQLQSYHLERFMPLDPQTARNLELFAGPPNGGPRRAALLSVIDQTLTPMGGRLLRSFLRYPLLDVVELRGRHDAVEWFLRRPRVREEARAALAGVLDLERLLGRVRRRLAVPAEVIGLGEGLQAVAQLRAVLEAEGAPAALLLPLVPCEDLVALIGRALGERAQEARSGVIRPGFSRELDQLRETLHGGRRFLSEFEERERQRTGIRSLKVGYHKVFGYYIEVTRPNLRLVPPDYLRKQTLSTAERFYTTALKEHEALIASAREGVDELEDSLFRLLCDEIGGHHTRLLEVARGVARIDVHAALAELAARRAYVRPELIDPGEDGPAADSSAGGTELWIRGGRHPIVESLPDTAAFQPNHTHLGGGGGRLHLITAPNMAGKSVYLRQVGLICLLAQIGSFVPAEAARLPILDRIFTRIGTEDGSGSGRSTFMSEMIETAHILHQATPRSLVLLDEVGRGTSTADGLAIARAVIEYLHNHPRLLAPTLFATHFHELTACAGYLPHVANFHLEVSEEGGQVRYLHRVAPGRAERSFGLHVAQMAGIPRPVLRRAEQLLRGDDPLQPEVGDAGAPAALDPAATTEVAADTRTAALVRTLAAIDINDLSPVEALTRLYELQQQARRLPGG